MSIHHYTRKLTTLAATAALGITLSLGAQAIAPDDASAHVRDKDKRAMCHGDNYRQHFHSIPYSLSDYYFHMRVDSRGNGRVNYTVYKSNRVNSSYDVHHKTVNC